LNDSCCNVFNFSNQLYPKPIHYDEIKNIKFNKDAFNEINNQLEWPKALYVHCVAYTLILAVSKANNIQPIRNCLGIIEKIYCFFNSPKRQNILLNTINESDIDPFKKKA